MTVTETELSSKSIAIPVEINVPDGYWERETSHAPRPLSPLERTTIMPPFVNHACRLLFTEMGALPETIDWREIGGWLYIRLVPPSDEEAIRRSVERATEAIRSDRFGDYLELWYTRWRPKLVDSIARLRGVDLPRLDDSGLAAYLAEVLEFFREALDIHLLIHGVGAVCLADLVFSCRDLLGWGELEAMALVSGLSEDSISPAARIAELATMAQDRPEVLALIERSDEQGVARLADTDPEFAAAFEAYQHEFGFRAIRYEIADPTIEEDPLFTLRLIRDQLQSGFDPKSEAALVAERREAARSEARALLTAHTAGDRERFERALVRAERFYPARDGRWPVTNGAPYALVRRAALEIGRRLTQRGVLDNRNDVFFLELEEVKAAIGPGGAGEDLDCRGLVTRRRAERTWVEAHPGPASYGRNPGPPPSLDGLPPEARFSNEALRWFLERVFGGERSRRRQQAGQILNGIPASPGRYTGPVRVLLDEGDFPKLKAGDVLVCPITSPPWSVLFPNLGALITDTGGILSHPAIIAREFRIPAVVATGNATRLLTDGQMVTVDGAEGSVEILA